MARVPYDKMLSIPMLCFSFQSQHGTESPFSMTAQRGSRFEGSKSSRMHGPPPPFMPPPPPPHAGSAGSVSVVM